MWFNFQTCTGLFQHNQTITCILFFYYYYEIIKANNTLQLKMGIYCVVLSNNKINSNEKKNPESFFSSLNKQFANNLFATFVYLYIITYYAKISVTFFSVFEFLLRLSLVSIYHIGEKKKNTK